MKTLQSLFILLFFCVPVFGADYDQYVGDALNVVNQKRAAQGLYPFKRDAEMDELCKKITYIRITTHHSGHLRNHMFTSLASAEGVGNYGGIDLKANHYITCFLMSKGYTYAAASYAVDDQYGSYYTLILR